MIKHDIHQHKQLNVLLIGDDCTDIYQYGTVDRISPEAPVPIFKISHKEERGGMARNVKHNLEKLGCSVNYLYQHTSVKTRLVDTKTKQQIVRIDKDESSVPIHTSPITLANYDAIVISDYDKGTVSYDTIRNIIQNAKCPIFIDTKKTELHCMEGAWVKINKVEYNRLKSECSGLIVTLGSEGVKVPHLNIEMGAPYVDVLDVTGAGDTFLAAFAYHYTHTNHLEASIKFAVAASTMTVQHFGVYAPTLEEINETIRYR